MNPITQLLRRWVGAHRRGECLGLALSLKVRNRAPFRSHPMPVLVTAGSC